MKALLLLLFGTLKFGKLATTGGSMLLSLAVYASIWGWRFAAGFIGLLFVHEMGHWVAAKHHGLKVGAPTFIPFVGAWIELKEQPMNARVEAEIAIAGPLVGTLASVAIYFLARQDGDRLYLAIAYSGFFLNLFNLLPLAPLDGGRVTQILSPRMWFLGAPLALAALLMWPSPALLLILLFSVPQLLAAWRFDPDAPENQRFHDTPLSTRVEYMALYLGLTGWLAVMTWDVHGMLQGHG